MSKAARLYPLLRFEYPLNSDKDKNKLKALRVDYCLQLSIERFQGNLTYQSNPLNQAGIFRDQESLEFITGGIPNIMNSGLTAGAVFKSAEKPLIYEVIANGLQRGHPGDWDNIHQWGVTYAQKEQILPLTPGAPHAAHLHWRWGKFAHKGGKFIGPGGEQHKGLAEEGGGAMVDPQIPDQNLNFAITKDNLVRQISNAESNDFYGFKDLFISNRKLPDRIYSGSNLANWFSIVVNRNHPRKIPSTWKGALFAHGLFFAHDNENQFSLIDRLWLSAAGVRGEIYIKNKPQRQWIRTGRK